ncbi:PfkB family carbohydrate kinase [Streptomyces sp. NPDC056227]|uniref:PfkB family carbohydrate kinase n=1 Tax=Streptomyces sp. NPDC056227 TaxID=3345753 RepID=UPI0035D5E153
MSLITVVGSVNRDFVLTVKNLPHPGETVLARHFVEGVGSKGANQDVAAARLGSRVRLVARVGADASVDALASEGVDVGAVRSNGLAATVIATAVVDDAGENTIVVNPGAGADLSVQDLPARLVRSPGEDVPVQHEIPPDVAERAVLRAHEQGGVVVLNPAPARSTRRYWPPSTSSSPTSANSPRFTAPTGPPPSTRPEPCWSAPRSRAGPSW